MQILTLFIAFIVKSLNCIESEHKLLHIIIKSRTCLNIKTAIRAHVSLFLLLPAGVAFCNQMSSVLK
jgi:hypothetical protein